MEQDLGEFARELERFFETGNFDSAVVPEIFQTIATVALIGICLVFIIFLIFFVIRQIAEAGLIQATYDIDHGLKTGFRSAFNSGYAHWLTFLGQIILIALPQLVLVAIMSAIGLTIFSRAAASPSPQDLLGDVIAITVPIFLCFFCLLVPYNIAATLIRPLAQRSVVLKEMGAWDGLVHGWRVLRENTVEVVLLAVLYVVLGIIISIALGIILAAFLLATVAPLVFTLIQGGDLGPTQIGLAVIGGTIATLVGVLVNGLGVTYRSVTFTLAYMHFTGLQGMTNLDSSVKGI